MEVDGKKYKVVDEEDILDHDLVARVYRCLEQINIQNKIIFKDIRVGMLCYINVKASTEEEVEKLKTIGFEIC